MDVSPRLALAAALLLPAGAVLAQPAGSAQQPAPLVSALDADLFYQLLLGELNARGSEPATGYALILDAARKTNNPALYERAVELALQARSGDAALQAARAWKQAHPQSREANRYVLQILQALNRVQDTAEPLKTEIALADPKDRPAVIGSIPRAYGRASDKKAAAAVVEQALADHLASPATGAAAWPLARPYRARKPSRSSGSATRAPRPSRAFCSCWPTSIHHRRRSRPWYTATPGGSCAPTCTQPRQA